MYVSQARKILRQWGRNAGSPNTYSAYDVDQTIYNVSNNFLRRTRVYRTQASRLITEAVSDYSLSSLVPTGWRPEMLTEALIADTDDLPLQAQPRALQIVNLSDIREMQAAYPQTGPPTMIAFALHTDMVVYPTPETAASYDVILRYCLPETTWAFGVILAPVVTVAVSGGAIVTATVNGGRVGGEFAASAPTVTLSGGGGSGGAVTAVLDSFGNSIDRYTVTAGSGYTSAPTGSFSATFTADTQLRLPDDLGVEVLRTGGVARLQGTTPEHAQFCKELRAEYEMFVRETAKVAGHLGDRVINRRSVDEMRENRGSPWTPWIPSVLE